MASNHSPFLAGNKIGNTRYQSNREVCLCGHVPPPPKFKAHSPPLRRASARLQKIVEIRITPPPLAPYVDEMFRLFHRQEGPDGPLKGEVCTECSAQPARGRWARGAIRQGGGMTLKMIDRGPVHGAIPPKMTLSSTIVTLLFWNASTPRAFHNFFGRGISPALLGAGYRVWGISTALRVNGCREIFGGGTA